MSRTSGLVSLAALSALLLTMASLACKPPAPPLPAEQSASSVRIDPAVAPRPHWTTSCSPNASGTEDCSEIDGPVCGKKADLTSTTFASRCAACSDPKVLYTIPVACHDEPPPRAVDRTRSL